MSLLIYNFAIKYSNFSCFLKCWRPTFCAMTSYPCFRGGVWSGGDADAWSDESALQREVVFGLNFAIPTSLVSKRVYTDITIPEFRFTSWKDDRVDNALVQLSIRYNFGKGSATKSNNQNRSESEK